MLRLQRTFRGRDGLKLSVMVPVGMATSCATDAQSWGELYGQADSAVYESMQAGKTRSTHFAPGVARP